MSKTVVVGLTGPMGSGKSTVAKLFCDNGYMLIDADKIAREVCEQGSKTLSLLADEFGNDIINADGSLNRALLSQKAFASKDKTALLNSITHPAIIELVKLKIADYSALGHNKIIYDAPLLFESKSDSLCDVVVSVVASKELRFDRIVRRDNLSESEIIDRFNAQHDESYYVDKSDYVIHNDSTNDELVSNTHAVISAINEVYNGKL